MSNAYLKELMRKNSAELGICERCSGGYQDVFGGHTDSQQFYNCATTVVGLFRALPMKLDGKEVYFWASSYGSGYDLLGFAIESQYVDVPKIQTQVPISYKQLERGPVCDLCIKNGLNTKQCKWICEYSLGAFESKATSYGKLLQVGYAFEQRCAALWQHQYGQQVSREHWVPFVGPQEELEQWSDKASLMLQGCYEQMQKQARKQMHHSQKHIKAVIASALKGT